MLIYLFLFFFTIGMGHCQKNQRIITIKSIKIDYFWAIFLPLLLLGVLRSSNIGYDTDVYYKDYYLISKWSIEQLMSREDPFFYLIIKCIRCLYDDYTFVRSVIYALTIVPYSLYVKKNSKNYGYSFGLYIAFQFLGFNFGILRQALAVSLMACAWWAIQERRYCHFVILSLVAFANHKTAILIMLLFFALNVQNKLTRVMEIVFLPIVILGFKRLLPILISGYQGGIYSNDTNSNAGHVQLIIYLFLIIMLLIIYKVFEKNTLSLTADLLIWCLIFQITALYLSVFARMNVYIWVILTVEATKLEMHESNERIVQEILLFVFSIIFIYSLCMNSQLIVPYEVFWNSVK